MPRTHRHREAWHRRRGRPGRAHCDARGVLVGMERIEARTVIWGAGVMASPAGRWLAAETDHAGRVKVGPDLSVPGCPDIFVIGDVAVAIGGDGKPLPGVAPVAKQQGKYVANLLKARLRGKTLPPFRYRDFGAMATIGRKRAVMQLGRMRTVLELESIPPSAFGRARVVACPTPLAPLPILSAQAWPHGALRAQAVLSLDRRLPTCQLSPGPDMPLHTLGSARGQSAPPSFCGRDGRTCFDTRRGGPDASPRHAVAAIGGRPHHPGDGCTLGKQTPRPAVVASEMGQNRPSQLIQSQKGISLCRRSLATIIDRPLGRGKLIVDP